MGTMDSTSDHLPEFSNIDHDFNDPKPQQSSKVHVFIQLARKTVNGITVEPLLFLALLGSSLSSAIQTNLLLIRTCEYMHLENCSSMDSKSGGPVEKIVQPYVAQLGMYKSILESVAPAIMAFFISPWSDIYGRRPLLFSSLLGYCLNHVLMIGFTWFELDPLFVLLSSVPLVLMGGSMTLYTGAFCYINDVSSKKDLPIRMALAEAMLFLGLLSGTGAAPYIYSLFPSHGFEGIFFISFVICLCALLYVVFLLPESIIRPEQNSRSPLRALFDFKQVLGVFQVVFGHYDGYSRFIRLTMIVVCLLGLISLEGTVSVSFLFVRNKFSWDLKEFSTYTDASLLMTVGGLLLGTSLFSKWCCLPNEPLVCFAYLIKAISYVIAGLGSHSWCLYASSGVGALGGMSNSLNRAILSDSIPKRDIGKLFALTSALSAAVPIFASLIYTPLYNSTMSVLPGSFYLFSAGLSVVCSIMLGSIIIHQKIYDLPLHRQVDDDSNQDLLQP